MDKIKNATHQADIKNDEGQKQQLLGKKFIKLPESIDELQRLLQIEADKRVSQALKTANEKWQQQLLKKLDSERKEAERLLMLSTEQKEKEILKKYSGEIEEMERALKYKELEIKIINLLIEREIPVEFKEIILVDDEKASLTRLENFCRIWRKKFEEGLNSFITCKLNEPNGETTKKQRGNSHDNN